MSRKAKNLEILRRHGIDVPKGFTLDATHYRAAIAPLSSLIIEALPSSQRVREIFLSAELPATAREFIDLQLAFFPGVERFAVRSSGTVCDRGRHTREDSEEVSLAGQFDSFLNVSRNFIPQAVQCCWASLYNERSITSFKADREYVLSSVMSIVIQEMVPAVASAVMMTVDPQGIGDVGGIEFTWGPCEAIVAGIASPDEVTFYRATGEILTTMIGPKECRVLYSLFSNAEHGNVVKVPTLPEERGLLSLTPNMIRKMINLGREIELIFGRPQDIEAVITADGRIVVTQARPITALPSSITPTPCPVAA